MKEFNKYYSKIKKKKEMTLYDIAEILKIGFKMMHKHFDRLDNKFDRREKSTKLTS